jgi:hypothetical protein
MMVHVFYFTGLDRAWTRLLSSYAMAAMAVGTTAAASGRAMTGY